MSGGRPDPTLTGRIGGLTAWSRHDAETMLGGARRGFARRFENLVIAAAAAEGRTLSPDEIAVRAERARRAHMLTLAAKSAAARRKRPGPDRDSGRAGTEGHADGRPPT